MVRATHSSGGEASHWLTDNWMSVLGMVLFFGLVTAQLQFFVPVPLWAFLVGVVLVVRQSVVLHTCGDPEL